MDIRSIEITDNNYEGRIIEDDSIIDNLRFIAQTPIEQLSENENLLIFPHSLGELHKDIEGKDTLIDLQGNILRTTNYMGFVGCGGVELSITSRFDTTEKNYLLNYMLQRVFAINLFDLQTSMDSTSIWDFLIFLFPYYLKKALRQGFYRKYQRREHNDSQVRGVVDLVRHIKQNIPYAGRIAYNTREYSSDNNLTQLIRHTIEYLNTHPLVGQNILCFDSETHNFVQQVILATPTYSRKKRSQVIAANLKPERHPYYTHYRSLQRLCLQILNGEKLNYSRQNDNKVYGLIFDGAWIWEEYLNTILSPLGLVHPRNKENADGVSMITNGLAIRYPDFYKEGIVLDAKYKWLDKYSSRDDVNQIITYMHCLPACYGGLIYPKLRGGCTPKEHYGTLKGHGGEFYRFFLNISNSEDYGIFIKEMHDAEEVLVARILELCRSGVSIV